MGEVLAELETALRNPKEGITQGEVTLLRDCKSKAIRAFAVGASITSALTWAATRSLSYGQRFNCSVGSAVLAGMWRFDRSLNGCVDQILQLEGSRMQLTLANIILKKHENNASKMEQVRKYFYPEQVFDDLNPDKPFFRWRPRSLFVDENTTVYRAEETEYGNDHYPEKTPDIAEQKKVMRKPGGEASAQKSAQTSSGEEMSDDPLDWLFGREDTSQETGNSAKARKLPRKSRAYKRAHRRSRAHHPETTDEL